MTGVNEEENLDVNESENEFFNIMVEEFESADQVGPECNPGLAKLVNKYLSSKMSESGEKLKNEQYLRPKNIEYSESPKTNKPVWETMQHYSRVLDSQLQTTQKNFLKSALPSTEVIGKLFEAKDSPSDSDAPDLFSKLRDALSFLGPANVNMVKTRKEQIKKVLPKNMLGLCRDSVEFSGSYLFGDNLNNKIKEVTELNKVAFTIKRGSFNQRTGSFGRFPRGNYTSRGSFSGYRRARGRIFFRYHPFRNSKRDSSRG